VHFLRFEFPAATAAAVRGGARVAVGIDHPACNVEVDPLLPAIAGALAKDLH
jgi:hypothetical protein